MSNIQIAIRAGRPMAGGGMVGDEMAIELHQVALRRASGGNEGVRHRGGLPAIATGGTRLKANCASLEEQV